MEIINGVGWDGLFWYKVLANTQKMSWQQMNQNFETIKLVSGQASDAVDLAQSAADAALVSAQAAGASATAATTAKNTAETAAVNATNAKNAAETARNTANTAATTATNAKNAAETARGTAETAATNATNAKNAAETARNTANTAATTATNAKNAAETARNTAVQKAGEANQSAIDAEYWAGQSQESASAVTSVQGKQGTVNLVRTDFSWMGTAAEATLNANNEDTTAGRVMRNGNHGIGGFGINVQGKDFSAPVSGFYFWGGAKPTGVDAALPNYVSAFVVKNTTSNAGRIFIDTNNSDFYFQGMGSSAWKDLVKGWHSKNLPSATQAEINAGTQAAPRLFSPKQISELPVLQKKLTITQSQTVARPTNGRMLIMIYGAGGAGNTGAYHGGDSQISNLGLIAKGGRGASGTSPAQGGGFELALVFSSVADGVVGAAASSSTSGSINANYIAGLEEVLTQYNYGGRGMFGSSLQGGAGGIVALHTASARELPANLEVIVGSASGNSSYRGGNGLVEIYY